MQTTRLPGTVGEMKKLFVKQKAPFNRRWPEVLFENGIKLQDNHSNIYAKSIYTAAVWRAVTLTVIKFRKLGNEQ